LRIVARDRHLIVLAEAAQPNLDEPTEPMSVTITRMPMVTGEARVKASCNRLRIDPHAEPSRPTWTDALSSADQIHSPRLSGPSRY
jgi:hypothetical protein